MPNNTLTVIDYIKSCIDDQFIKESAVLKYLTKELNVDLFPKITLFFQVTQENEAFQRYF